MSSIPDLSFDENAAIERLQRFLAVEGVTGQEQAIARAVAGEPKVQEVIAKRDQVHHPFAA